MSRIITRLLVASAFVFSANAQSSSQSTGIDVTAIFQEDDPSSPFWSLAELCAEKLGSTVITRRITEPWKSEKYILVIS